jgi:hypothetical protein
MKEVIIESGCTRTELGEYSSLRLKLSYSFFVCFPGSALSSSVVYFPTPLGNSLFSLKVRSAIPRNVALTPVSPVPIQPISVARFAAFFALFLRLISP